MRSVWLVALAACGCRSILGIEDPLLETPPIDAPAVCAMWRPHSFDPCALGQPMPALQLTTGSYTYDTSTGGGRLSDMAGRTIRTSDLTLAQSGDSQLAVLSVAALTIDEGATIRVIGVKPLLLVSWSAIAVDGAIDASSHLVVTDVEHHIEFGAGANVGCGDNVGKNGVDAMTETGSGGGGGGGFQGAGGAASAGGATAGGMGGAAVSAPVIRGGCPGGGSGVAGTGASVPASTKSQGGAGGGAIRLVAHDSIAVAGSISASGAGGAGGPPMSSCGGGGGGSGGDVELEAPIVTITGTVAANGGGGGGGGNAIESGIDGADGVVGDVAASGGATAPSSCGAAGGAGSARSLIDGESALAPSSCGGGGGGGGAGFIFVASPGLTAPSSATISPAVSIRS